VTQALRELQSVGRPEPGNVEQCDVDAFLLADRERFDRSDSARAAKAPRGQRLTQGRGPVSVVADNEYMRQFGRQHVPLCKGLARNAFRSGMEIGSEGGTLRVANCQSLTCRGRP